MNASVSTNPTIRQYLLRRHGAPDILELARGPSPVAGPGDVGVRVSAIGVNYAEILSRKGLYGWAPKMPYVPGMEAAGVIDALGPGVTDRVLGEPVVVGTQFGCYAERVVVPAVRALPGVAGYSAEENAAFAVNYATAWVALMEMARLRPADRVLVTAAAGGVGTAAVQLATAFGCDVIGAVGSDAKTDRVISLGARRGMTYGAIRSQVKDVDVVLELVGGPVYRDALETLAPFGRLVVAGFASLNLQRWNPWSWWRTWRDIPRASIADLAQASRGVLASHLGYLLDDPPRLLGVWRDLTAFVERHGIRPVIGATFPFERMAEAHRLIESRRSVGKVVVEVRSEK
jgi:NADPH:quinone reductase-like Zn-dependent oxidoreductase